MKLPREMKHFRRQFYQEMTASDKFNYRKFAINLPSEICLKHVKLPRIKMNTMESQKIYGNGTSS